MQLGRCTDNVEPHTAFANDTIPMYTCSTDQLFWVAWHAGTGTRHLLIRLERAIYGHAFFCSGCYLADGWWKLSAFLALSLPDLCFGHVTFSSALTRLKR